MTKYKAKRVLLTETSIDTLDDLEENGLFTKSLPHGIIFDSRLEAEYYRDVLLPRIQSGEIEVQMQPKFEVLGGYKSDDYKFKPVMYIPDFLLTYRDGTREAVDVKGFETDAFVLKRKMFHVCYPTIRLLVIEKLSL